ncbi:MAG: DoxX family membrane protein [Deltaproteobacteria bacterium]|nr:DoxX family membrane protein [Deltaproteobacteria bacterium]
MTESAARLHRRLAVPIRLYLGGVFLWASWHKILDPHGFALDIATYDILPLGLVNLQALLLPWIELVAAGALIAGLWSRAAAVLTCGMMLMFTVALGIALHRGLDTSCGCFASTLEATDPISGWTIARDLLWLGLALYVAAFDRRPWGLEALLFRRKAIS